MQYRKVTRQIKDEVGQQQHRLDEALGDLGRRVRAEEPDHPPITAAMAAVQAVEQQRAGVDSAQGELESRQQQEEATFAAIETDCKERIAAAETEASQVQTELSEVEGRHQALTRQLAEIEKQTKDLTRQRNDKQAQAARTQDASAQETLQGAVADLGVQIGDREREREGVGTESARVSPVVEQRQVQLRQVRGRIQEMEKELAAAGQNLAAGKREIDGAKRQQGAEATRLDHDLSQRFLELGQTADESRIPGESFAGFYSQIEALRAEVGGREQEMGRLGDARDDYDRQAFKNGIILLSSAGGGILLIILLLIILL